MGGSYINRMPAEGAQAFVDKLLTGDSSRVLRSAMVGDTYYAAVEARGGDVFAAIVLTEGRFGWKTMDESCGPYYWDCPAEILDMLTPTEQPYARKWREACRARIKQLGVAA